MPLSVEVRVEIQDVNQAVGRVAELTGEQPTVVEQEDVFFSVHRGRLMMRRQDGQAELIFYSKREVSSPRASAYFRRPVEDPSAVEAELAARFGIRQRVRKRRWMFEIRGTRINIDSVESLGSFLEIGVPARDETSIPHAHAAIRKLTQALELDEKRLVAQEYETLLGEAES